jgi:hypothetical protein
MRSSPRGPEGAWAPPTEVFVSSLMRPGLPRTQPRYAVAPERGIVRVVLSIVRYWLPLVVTLAGVAVMVIGRDADALEGGAGIVGAGLAIWLLNFLYRVGAHDDEDRDEEDAARDFFDRHGHWPDEAPPAPAEPRGRRAAQRPGPEPERPRTGGRDATGRGTPGEDLGPHRTASPDAPRRRPAAPRRRSE